MLHWLASLTLMVGLLARAVGLPVVQTPPPPDHQEVELAARAFLEQLIAADYSAAAASFDETMAAQVPASRLQSIWEGVITSYGPLQEVESAVVSQEGEYRAVDLKTRFERATVNIRVVYNQAGQVSGFFQRPLDLAARPSAAFLVMLGLSALFVLLLPIVLGWWAWRRWGVSWKYFLLGALIFLFFQIFTRIPIISIIQANYGSQLTATPLRQWAWLVALSFTAGLFEETGRYVGYRWLMRKDPKTWAVGVMYGLGHGGIEAILLVGVSLLSSLVLLMFWPTISTSLPPAQIAPIAAQLAPLVNAPLYLPLMGAWERLWAVALHVSLSLMVLQVFRRGQLRWLWLAMGLHTLVNLVVIGLPMALHLSTQAGQWLSSGLMLLVGLAALAIIRTLKDKETV